MPPRSSYRIRLPQLLDVLSVALLLGLLVSVWRIAPTWMENRRAQGVQRAMASAVLAVGERIEATVVSDDDGSIAGLSDIGAGSCRYVILGSRSCPHTRTAADRWMLTALNDPSGARMPDGWEAMWVITDQVTGRHDLFDEGFPSPTYFARDPVDLVTQAGVSQVPMHLVIDRDGVVIAAGAERRLLPMSAFRDDCFIDTPAFGNAAGADPIRP